MSQSLSTNTKQIQWLGARYGSLSAVIGCAVFFLVEGFLFLYANFSSFFTYVIFLLPVASLFTLPFAAVGGYSLGWFLQKMKWRKRYVAKAVMSGMATAAFTIAFIFILGGSIQTCLGSHGECEGNFIAFTTRVVLAELEHGVLSRFGLVLMRRFFIALPIAAACGGVTAWRLARVIQGTLGVGIQ